MPLAVGGDTAKPINLARRAAIMKQHIAPNDFVLDVGCGRGEYLRTLLDRTPNAFGIETSAEKLRDCFSAHPELAGHVFDVGAEAMPFPDAHFDVVILNEVLEHVAAQDAALREIHRVLKKDGKLLLFCPNRLYPFETHGFIIHGTHRKWVPALNYLPAHVLGRMGIECVAYNYWPREVVSMLKRHGFRIEHRGFVQQTFENISGAQPRALRLLRPLLRRSVEFLGTIPVMRGFVSVSSFVVAVG